MMKWPSLIFSCICLLIIFHHHASAQVFDRIELVKIDSNYIKAYKDELTARFYVSRKQNGYNLSERLVHPWLKYRTNENMLLGMGYTYNFLTLNLSVKMPFINKDDHIYGTSKYFDMQAHTIFRSFIVDLYLQWNKGYYLSNPEKVIPGWNTDNLYPIRGDLRTHIMGLNVQYLFNSSRFSYKASFLQNEFQKKSAGSPIAGIEGYWMLGMTDTAMVAGNIPPSDFINGNPFNQVDITNFGINGGYAYTFVWAEKLFLSLSSVFGISVGNNQVHYTVNSITSNSGISAGLTNTTRISLGYDNNKYYVGLSYNRFAMSNYGGNQGGWFSYNTGNIRIIVARRFLLKRPIIILRPDLWILSTFNKKE